MYRVVGCRACGALWIVADRPETTGCPRCGTRHRFGALHAFYETDDEAAARRARAALLAERAGHGGVVDEAGERAMAGPAKAAPKREVVFAALDALERPTEAEVVGYAADRDVPPEAVSDVLAKLVYAGEVTESGGRYRRV